MEIEISKIKIGKRFRACLENIDSLAEDIRKNGLINPITVTKDFKLLAGRRRLEAAKKLGWKTIPYTIKDKDDIEISENEERVNYNAYERETIYQRRLKIESVGTKEQKDQTKHLDRNEKGQLKPTSEKFSEVVVDAPDREARRRAAKTAGISFPTAEKIKEIKESGYTDLIERLKQNNPKVDRQHKEMIRRKAAEKNEKERTKARYKSTITVGDFREVGQEVKDASADLIFTDPPYSREYLPLWEDLARLARRVLKPNGMLIAYSGQTYLPEVMRALDAHLQYYWMAAAHLSGGGNLQIRHRSILNQWKPLLMYIQKNGNPVHEWILDLVKQRPEKTHHEWEQDVDVARYYIRNLCPEHGLVVEPFCGGGTTVIACMHEDRMYWACEIDQTAADIAEQRIREFARNNNEQG